MGNCMHTGMAWRNGVRPKRNVYVAFAAERLNWISEFRGGKKTRCSCQRRKIAGIQTNHRIFFGWATKLVSESVLFNWISRKKQYAKMANPMKFTYKTRPPICWDQVTHTWNPLVCYCCSASSIFRWTSFRFCAIRSRAVHMSCVAFLCVPLLFVATLAEREYCNATKPTRCSRSCSLVSSFLFVAHSSIRSTCCPIGQTHFLLACIVHTQNGCYTLNACAIFALKRCCSCFAVALTPKRS